MNCTKLDDYLATQDDPRSDALPAELQQHLHVCAGCRADWQACRTLHRSIAVWNAQQPMPLDTDRLATALVQAEIRPAVTLPRRYALASAATVAAAVMALLLWRGAPQPDRPQREIVVSPPRAIEQPIEATPTVSELWAEVRASSEPWVAVPKVSPLPTWSGLPLLPELTAEDPPVELPVSALDAAPRDVWADVSRPVRDQVGEAFRFLRVAWPAASGAPRG